MRVVLVVGNELIARDHLAYKLAKRWKGAKLIFAGSCPELWLQELVKLKPKKLVVLDAIHMGARVGEVRKLKLEQLQRNFVFTHRIPLRQLLEHVRSRTGCEIEVIGIQPKVQHLMS